MSFFKMPSQVVKTVKRIQREFLWGGVNGGRKTNWISWKTVCREKKHGGLGVRDVKVVNISLLSKWRWKLLGDESALWKQVIVAKYGGGLSRDVAFNNTPGVRFASNWWKDICAIENCVAGKNWLLETIRRRMNNGAATLFWTHQWMGEASLAVLFPRLFSLSSQKDGTVKDMYERVGDSLQWRFNWRRRLFRWEEELVNELHTLLEQVRVSEEEDCWWWLPDPDGVFSVKSCYLHLSKELFDESEIDGSLIQVLEHIWSSPAPSKIIAFSWQLLHNRIPTRDNLMRCGIIRDANLSDCVVCEGVRESSTHLFLHCQYAAQIWGEIFKWLGVILVMPDSLQCFFEYFSGFARSNKARKGFHLVWHTALWLIWKVRNDVIFNNVAKNALECAEDIKVLSWKWSAHKLKISPCLYYEWCWDPGSCFVS
jgi:hypothetical protein